MSGAARAEVPEGHEFASQARALFRVAACGGDLAVPSHLDQGIVDKNCAILKAESAWFKARWVDRARPFLGKLQPAGLPTRAVYPFGGGDLIAALVTFPDATEVTTLSLEPAGDPRPIDQISAESLETSLGINRGKMVRLFHVGHSLTSDLSRVTRHNRLPGELIYALTGLSILGYEPISLRYFRIEKDGSLHYITDAEIAAADQSGEPRDVHVLFSNMEMQFRPIGKDGPVRIHRHIGADLDDKHLGADPKVVRFLESRGRVVVMTKAASFLLWWDDFSIFRNYLLKNMEWMVSDSTGIPPRYARAAGFSQETYGRFDGPLLPKVGKKETEEFRELWDGQPRRALPFRFGYPDSGKHPHLLVTFKRSPAH